MTTYDVIVIGAGPAGLAAAITARALRMRALVLEAGPHAGGQLLNNPTPIVDSPGLQVDSGPALAERLLEHLIELGGEVRAGAEVRRVDAAAGAVETAEATFTATALLLATGATRRRLGVPGEADEPGRGLSPAARRYGSRFAGRPMLVVGGGDVALEEAALLARICPRVVLVHRGERLGGRPDFRAAALRCANLEPRMQTQLLAIEGDERVEAARLRGPDGECVVEAAGVVICAGLAARSELVAGQCGLDDRGFVRVDTRQRTDAARLYAAGDVCAGSTWTVAAAIGQAAVAIKDLERRIAAGEFAAGPREDDPFAPTSFEGHDA
ncbi:MAG: FAD-dependent oxidoreductase [Myxococcales bacterium]|nr:FAD-dependent oxidoreductase [Myxococcales bacterium]